MRKTILNITLVTALGFSSVGATPAMANDNERLGQILLGVAALAILGKAIEDRKDRKQATTHNPPRQVTAPRRKVLPRDCVRRHATRQGHVRMAAQRCLKNSNVRVNRLPDGCFERVRTLQGKVRRGFGVRCLKNRGFVFR